MSDELFESTPQPCCEYLYEYHRSPVRCVFPAEWVLEDGGNSKRFCTMHKEDNETDGFWRRLSETGISV